VFKSFTFLYLDLLLRLRKPVNNGWCTGSGSCNTVLTNHGPHVSRFSSGRSDITCNLSR